MLQLSEQFKKMGAVLPFDKEKADFSGINANPNEKLHISLVQHKAFVEVTEEGTEAAAATAITCVAECIHMKKPREIEFVCDRPFLFMIHDNPHNNILFLGKYVKPN